MREAQEYWSEQPIPSPGDLPIPGIEPGSPALQADSSFFFFQLIFFFLDVLKIWNTSRICMSSLHRGHANLLCSVPILVYVLPKRALQADSLPTELPGKLEGNGMIYLKG